MKSPSQGGEGGSTFKAPQSNQSQDSGKPGMGARQTEQPSQHPGDAGKSDAELAAEQTARNQAADPNDNPGRGDPGRVNANVIDNGNQTGTTNRNLFSYSPAQGSALVLARDPNGSLVIEVTEQGRLSRINLPASEAMQARVALVNLDLR